MEQKIILKDAAALVPQLHMRAAPEILWAAAARQLHAAGRCAAGLLEARQVLVVGADIFLHPPLHDAVLEEGIVAEEDGRIVQHPARAAVQVDTHHLQHAPTGGQHGLGEARECGISADGSEVDGRRLAGKRLGDDLVARPVKGVLTALDAALRQLLKALVDQPPPLARLELARLGDVCR